MCSALLPTRGGQRFTLSQLMSLASCDEDVVVLGLYKFTFDNFFVNFCKVHESAAGRALIPFLFMSSIVFKGLPISKSKAVQSTKGFITASCVAWFEVKGDLVRTSPPSLRKWPEAEHIGPHCQDHLNVLVREMPVSSKIQGSQAAKCLAYSHWGLVWLGIFLMWVLITWLITWPHVPDSTSPVLFRLNWGEQWLNLCMLHLYHGPCCLDVMVFLFLWSC